MILLLNKKILSSAQERRCVEVKDLAIIKHKSLHEPMKNGVKSGSGSYYGLAKIEPKTTKIARNKIAPNKNQTK